MPQFTFAASLHKWKIRVCCFIWPKCKAETALCAAKFAAFRGVTIYNSFKVPSGRRTIFQVGRADKHGSSWETKPGCRFLKQSFFAGFLPAQNLQPQSNTALPSGITYLSQRCESSEQKIGRNWFPNSPKYFSIENQLLKSCPEFGFPPPLCLKRCEILWLV